MHGQVPYSTLASDLTSSAALPKSCRSSSASVCDDIFECMLSNIDWKFGLHEKVCCEITETTMSERLTSHYYPMKVSLLKICCEK